MGYLIDGTRSDLGLHHAPFLEMCTCKGSVKNIIILLVYYFSEFKGSIAHTMLSM